MAKYIDAEAFFKLINTTLPYDKLDYPDKAVYNAAISDVCGMLTHFPPADVQEVQHGHWIDVIGDGRLFECSACGRISCCNEAYCNECGAAMKGPNEND